MCKRGRRKGKFLILFFVILTSLLFSAGLARAQDSDELLFGVVPFEATNVPNIERPPYPDLTCKPAPCVLPNVNTSGTTKAANETPVAVNPQKPKQILVGANDHGCANGSGFYASLNGGKTWSRTCINPVAGQRGYADPVVGYDLKGNAFVGNVDIGTGTSTIAMEKSSDGGKTWSDPFPSVEYLLDSNAFPDKPWLQIDTNPNSIYANSLYISTTQFDSSNNSEMTVASSHDGGQTWLTVPIAPLQMFTSDMDEFSAIAIGADGTVYVTWMRCQIVTECAEQTATFYIVKSSDGGNTWTTPAPMFTATLAPDTCGCGFWGSLPKTKDRVTDIPVIGVDNSNGPGRGYLYVVYNTWTGRYMQVRVATSIDGGTTWTSTPVAPKTDKHDQFFPWLSVSRTGVVGVSWLDRRNDPSNINYEAFAAFSTDGGATFGTNYDLSAGPSNPFNDGLSGTFIGDYSGNSWAGPKTLYVTYTDTSTGIAQAFLGGVKLK